MVKKHTKAELIEFRWFTSGGHKIGINDETGEVIAPEWYKQGQKDPSKIKTLCPECGRKLNKGVCRVHGKVR